MAFEFLNGFQNRPTLEVIDTLSASLKKSTPAPCHFTCPYPMKNLLSIPPKLQPFIIHSLDTKYAKRKPLGKGGQADVYLARDLQSNMNVVLRILRTDLDDSSPSAHRFLSEIVALFRCRNHPFLLQFIGCTSHPPLTLVTEYISSTTLSHFLSDRRFHQESNNGTTLTHISSMA
jgi:serine/threonine protein kinase